MSEPFSRPASPPPDAPAPGPAPASLLHRPAAHRYQEFKYRFGQSLVFGLPVLTLGWFGRSLGGVEADRWVTLFQALLAGWVVYVAATGMLAEVVLLLLARQPVGSASAADGAVALLSVLLYTAGLPRLVLLLAASPRAASWPAWFGITVVLLAAWCGLRLAGIKKARPDRPAERDVR